MGIGRRIFLVNDNDSIQRLAVTKYEGLLRRDPKEALPQYANTRIRYASVALNLVNRRPVDVIYLHYGILCFDTQGLLDIVEQQKERRLGLEITAPLISKDYPFHLIDARHRFAKKRYTDHYTWMPSPEVVAAIVKEIFG